MGYLDLSGTYWLFDETKICTPGFPGNGEGGVGWEGGGWGAEMKAGETGA